METRQLIKENRGALLKVHSQVWQKFWQLKAQLKDQIFPLVQVDRCIPYHFKG